MTFAEALESVSKKYVPGVVSYYGKFSTDPWQRAHDELNSQIEIHKSDPKLHSLACESFVERCLQLIEKYKLMDDDVKTITPADAFALGDETRFNKWLSLKEKFCMRCQKRDNLSMRTDEDGLYFMKCSECEKTN